MVKILAIGDNNVDIYVDEKIVYPGGNGVNVAAFARMLEVESAYVGLIGKDYFGDVILNGLEKMGVDIDFVKRIDDETGWAQARIVNADRIWDGWDMCLCKRHMIDINEELMSYIKKYDVLHTDIYANFDMKYLERFYNLGIPICMDFSTDFSETEFSEKAKYLEVAFCSCADKTMVETEEILKMASFYGARCAIGTRGVNGSVLYDGKKYYHENIYRVEAKDAMGSGDSFITRFLITYVDGIKTIKEYESIIRPDDLSRYKEKVIEYAMTQAALFSAHVCMMDGAFGYGMPIKNP